MVAISWNNLEADLEERIWQIAKWSNSVGAFVTTHMPNSAKLELFNNLVSFAIDDEALRGYSVAWFSFFDKVRERRNNVVHALPRFGATGFDSYVKRATRKGKGTISLIEHEFDAATVESVVRDIRLCEAGSYVLFSKLMRFFNSISLPSNEEPEIEQIIVTRLRERLAELSRQYPAKGRHQTGPQSPTS